MSCPVFCFKISKQIKALLVLKQFDKMSIYPFARRTESIHLYIFLQGDFIWKKQRN